ncbi:hypothetical protein [uncultured Wocania sp.]|uniref:hypothetical protein n=1 Tax=uncultured Wocania sp. TaxID=2834404 RepID=UPI0030F63201
MNLKVLFILDSENYILIFFWRAPEENSGSGFPLLVLARCAPRQKLTTAIPHEGISAILASN